MTRDRKTEVNRILRQMFDANGDSPSSLKVVNVLCHAGFAMEVGDEILVVYGKLNEHDIKITKMKKGYVWGEPALIDEEKGHEIILSYKELYESWLGDEETDVLAVVAL